MRAHAAHARARVCCVCACVCVCVCRVHVRFSELAPHFLRLTALASIAHNL
jgi:hypothetical protein